MKQQPANIRAKSQPLARGDRKTLDPAIEFRRIHLAFGKSAVLRGISFKVPQGEMKILLGGSGTGKSTVLKLALGLLKPDRGQIVIDGQDITLYSERRLMGVRKKIGMVFQEGALFDSLSVYDNVAFRLHEQGIAENKVENQVRRMLRFVDLENVIDFMPDALSGGMKRRVGIARALVGKPSILLFDEPTAGLDPPTSRVVSQLAIKLRDVERVSSLVVTHRMNILNYLCSRRAEKDRTGQIRIHRIDEARHLPNASIVMLHEGKVIFDGTSESLHNSTDPYIRKFLRGR